MKAEKTRVGLELRLFFRIDLLIMKYLSYNLKSLTKVIPTQGLLTVIFPELTTSHGLHHDEKRKKLFVFSVCAGTEMFPSGVKVTIK